MKEKCTLALLALFLLPLSGFAQQDQQEQLRRQMERMQEEMNRLFEQFEVPTLPEDGYLQIDTFFFHRIDPGGEGPLTDERFPEELNRMFEEFMQGFPGWEEGESGGDWQRFFKGFGAPWPFPEDGLPESEDQKPASKKRRTYTL